MRNGSMHGLVADERLGGRCRHFFPPSRVHFPSGGHASETAAAPQQDSHLVGTHPKQQNPSRIQTQRVATWSAAPVPFSTFEPAKSKGGWVGLEALAGIGWVDVTALGSIVGYQPLQRHVTAASPAGEHGTPARFRPNGLPLGRQSRCRLAPSNPLKAKADGWGWKLWQALVGLT